MPREAREEQILDAATLEFGVRGYATGSVEQVARSVGVSRAMVHAYFGSKDELYLACLERAARPLAAAITAAQDLADPPLLRGLVTIKAILTTLEPRPHDWPMLWDPTVPDGAPVAAGVRAQRRSIAGLGVDGAAQALRDDGVEDQQDLAFVGHLWLDVVSSIVQWWLRHPDETAEAVGRRFERVLATLVDLR
ncbi:TetR/AcrR family transcriptional regulator [Patulibacter defluvii]|uniref:TetR/AcrR family transcriptional regulator n=1 Tax=Patulibacter defluvii TaxID=3095358 RepID=UPI002A754F98|nr:TetR/AcrR family transcriptional regulator [Patulibacter sp. DM4]